MAAGFLQAAEEISKRGKALDIFYFAKTIANFLSRVKVITLKSQWLPSH